MFIITGASGGIGSYLSNYFKTTNKIFAIYNKRNLKIKHKNLLPVNIDITNTNQIENFIQDNKKKFKWCFRNFL